MAKNKKPKKIQLDLNADPDWSRSHYVDVRSKTAFGNEYKLLDESGRKSLDKIAESVQCDTPMEELIKISLKQRHPATQEEPAYAEKVPHFRARRGHGRWGKR